MAATAPRHLASSTAAWYRSVVEDYELAPHHLHLLRLAGEAFDRCAQARAAIDENGLVYQDRFGAPRPRPVVAIERDARLGFARLLQALGLEDTPADPRLSRKRA